MKIGIISFTEGGARLCVRLHALLKQEGEDCRGYVPERFFRPEWEAQGIIKQHQTPGQWTCTMFREDRDMVFIGAAGIAVRAAAPYIKDKMKDPALVVVDEGGRFSIPLLSGHVGGANQLAVRIAEAIGAQPVITTATDVRGVFAVDLFAVKNGLTITDRTLAKKVSASLLEGKPVGFFSDFPFKDKEKGLWMPKGCTDRECQVNLWITSGTERRFEKECLYLVPQCITVGIGCRRGTSRALLEAALESALKGGGFHPAAVKALASIDVKADEAGLLELAEKRGWELKLYPAERLLAVEGEFEESEFVRQRVGVGNVCERACMAEGGRLIIHKQAGEGVTVAAAQSQVWLEALAILADDRGKLCPKPPQQIFVEKPMGI